MPSNYLSSIPTGDDKNYRIKMGRGGDDDEKKYSGTLLSVTIPSLKKFTYSVVSLVILVLYVQ